MMNNPESINNGWIYCQTDECAWWDGKQCAILTIAQNTAPVELEQCVTLESTCDAENIAKSVAEVLKAERKI